MTATAQGAGLAVTASDGPSWVSVRDAGGHVLISRTLQSGESVLLDGPPPLRVTIGDARAVHLSFRGQAVALPPNQTVARLELK
jgi:cytoskeleton protein RodZ